VSDAKTTPDAATDKAAAETAAQAKALDDAKLRQIVAMLEAALDRPDGAAARRMLDEMRPKLVEARPPRRQTLRRILCQSFEDMLVEGATSGALIGRIPRAVIMPAWAIFLERGNKELIAKAEANLNDKATVAAACDHFVTMMKTEIAEAQAFASKGKTLLLKLGGEAHYLSLDNVVNAVSIFRQIAKLKAALPPKPIGLMKDSHLDALANILNEIRKASPDCIATALFIVMARMAEPWKISTILEELATSGRFKSSAGIKEFSGAALVGRIETHVQEVQAIAAAAEAKPAGDAPAPSKGAAAAEVATEVSGAVQSLVGTREALERSGSTAQLREVERARLRLREVVDEKIVGGAANAIVNAVSGGGKAGRVDKAPDPQQLRDAELRAVALRRSTAYADLLTIEGEVTDNIKKATEGVDRAASELFGQIRRAKLDKSGKEAARGHVMANARLMEILAGPDKAEALLNRGLEALDSAT
jgi:hypothetical protein